MMMDDIFINGGKSDVESIFDFRGDWGNREQDRRIFAGSGRLKYERMSIAETSVPRR